MPKRQCNKENMTKLVEALESGRYEQARGQLRVRDKFCCLGVACDISGLGEWRGLEDGWPVPAYYVDSVSSTDVMPVPVQIWLGAHDNRLEIDLDALSENRLAAVMNDRGDAFPAIAAAIREAYLTD